MDNRDKIKAILSRIAESKHTDDDVQKLTQVLSSIDSRDFRELGKNIVGKIDGQNIQIGDTYHQSNEEAVKSLIQAIEGNKKATEALLKFLQETSKFFQETSRIRPNKILFSPIRVSILGGIGILGVVFVYTKIQNNSTLDGTWVGTAEAHPKSFTFSFEVKNNQIEKFKIPEYKYGKSVQCPEKKEYQNLTIFTKDKLNSPIPINNMSIDEDDSSNYIILDYRKTNNSIVDDAIKLEITGKFIDQNRLKATGTMKEIESSQVGLKSNRPNAINCIKIPNVAWTAKKNRVISLFHF